MKRLIAPALVLGWMLVLVPQSQAFFGLFNRCCPPPCPVPCYVPAPCYQVECIPVKCTIMVPRCVDVKRTITVCIPVPREMERDVCCVKYVPTPCVDCNGCTYTCLKPEVYTKRVRYMVYDCRYEPRDVMCKTVVYDPQVVIRNVYRCVPVACGLPGSSVMPNAK